MVELHIVPVLTLGAILGLYELILVHRDQHFRGSHWFGHGIHSVLIMIVALFIVLNTELFFELAGVENWGLPSFLTNPWVFRVLVGLVINIKMHATTAVLKGGLRSGVSGSMAEHWSHTTIISALVVTTPLYWPLLAHFLPDWAQ